MKRLSLLFTLLSGAVILFFLGCSKNENAAKSMEQLHQEQGVPVHITPVQEVKKISKITYHAVLTGIKESTASAKVDDRIERILKSVGDYVQKGAEVLTFPENNPASQYNQARVANEHAQTTLKRMDNLYESGGISLQELDNVRTQTRVAEANWDAVRQSIKVCAPISGVITQMNVSETENVKSGDVLFTVSDTRGLKTHLWVTESDIQILSVGDKAEAVWNNILISGHIVQIDKALNTAQQAFGLRVEFENPGQKIISGVNAEIHLISEQHEPAIWIERKNLQTRKDGSTVFVAENGVARVRPVQIGKEIDLDVEIISGLHAGEALVIEGQHLLEDGMKINVLN